MIENYVIAYHNQYERPICTLHSDICISSSFCDKKYHVWYPYLNYHKVRNFVVSWKDPVRGMGTNIFPLSHIVFFSREGCFYAEKLTKNS